MITPRQAIQFNACPEQFNKVILHLLPDLKGGPTKDLRLIVPEDLMDYPISYQEIYEATKQPSTILWVMAKTNKINDYWKHFHKFAKDMNPAERANQAGSFLMAYLNLK